MSQRECKLPPFGRARKRRQKCGGTGFTCRADLGIGFPYRCLPFLEISQTPNFSRRILGPPLFPLSLLPPPAHPASPCVVGCRAAAAKIVSPSRAVTGTKRNTAGNGFSNATFPLRVYAVTRLPILDCC